MTTIPVCAVSLDNTDKAMTVRVTGQRVSSSMFVRPVADQDNQDQANAGPDVVIAWTACGRGSPEAG
jgi:hypothetical protein